MKRSSLRSRAPLAVWVAATFAMAATGFAGTAGPVVAANDHVRVDVSPEDGSGLVGATVTLTVVVLDEDDAPLDGSHARFYFLAGSPNDSDSPGNNPDMSCTTDAMGTCSVSYLAANAGVDLVCAVVSGGSQLCDTELLGDAELDGRSDLVRHTTGQGGQPDPTPDPNSTPDPTPAVDPSPSPAVDPSPSPAVDPSPSPAVDPSPSPAVDPSPSPAVDPSPSPAVDPSPSPAVDPSPSPAVDPESTPGPTPTPTSTSDPTPESFPTPSPTVSPAPQSTPAPTPAATPTPPPTPAPTANATPTPEPTPDPTPDPTPAPATEPDTDPTDPPAPSAPPEASPSSSPDPAVTPTDPDSDASPSPTPNRHIAVGGPVTDPGTGPGTGNDSASNGGAILPPPVGDDGGILAIVSGVADQVSQSVKPAAAVAVAATFGFPLLLMVAVLLYLVVQPRLDGRDPKLRAAPLTTADTLIPFRDEDAL